MGCKLGKATKARASVASAEPKSPPVSGPSTQPLPSREEYNDKHEGLHNPTQPLPDPPPAPDPNSNFKTKAEAEVLKVISVDLKVAENSKVHHTDRYELAQAPEDASTSPSANATGIQSPPAVGSTGRPCLVVRRGEPFDIAIKFDRPFDSQRDDIKLIFDFGDNPRENRGTRVVLLLSDDDEEPKKWTAKVMTQTSEELSIRVCSPPHVAVAKWKFSFDTVLRLDDRCQAFRYNDDRPVYLLFNPWSSDDQVFMSDESERQEYVLNDSGRIFFGTKNQIGSMPWNFGQFEDFVLEAIMFLLNKSGLNSSLRGNPVHVVRKISAMANAPDDNGVLVGNWSGDYSDGTSPVAWNGSVAILEQYWKTRESVSYGQCWVFSGIVTTICRALGIPCRSVTNFVSAHDCDASLTVDVHWDEGGNRLHEFDEDSVWNFHVWNDVWMSRPDLPSGFGGWQAIDATPQETSEGVYCTGPASLEAIKNGLVQFPYDGSFIFAEVNADRIHCIQTKEGEWKHTFQNNYIGKNISTKGPDVDDRLDITSLYKFSEGSQQERTAVWRAVSLTSTKKNLYKVEAEDMDFNMVHKEDCSVGEPFDVVLKIHNKSQQQRTVRVTLLATVIHYTGVPVTLIKSEANTVQIESHAEREVKMTVRVNDYIEKVTDMCHLKIGSMSQVTETNQFHCDSDDFRLCKPIIVVKVPSEIKLNEDCDVEASFANPLFKILTNCEFSFEAASLMRPVKITYSNVSPRGVAKCSVKLTAVKEGEKEMIVGFWSKELSGLNGTAKIKVSASQEDVPAKE